MKKTIIKLIRDIIANNISSQEAKNLILNLSLKCAISKIPRKDLFSNNFSKKYLRYSTKYYNYISNKLLEKIKIQRKIAEEFIYDNAKANDLKVAFLTPVYTNLTNKQND